MMVGETLKFSFEITVLMSSRKTFRLHSWSFEKLSFACLAGGIVMGAGGQTFLAAAPWANSRALACSQSSPGSAAEKQQRTLDH